MRNLFASVEELISPTVMGTIVGWRVDTVRLLPFGETVDSYSGSSLESVEVLGAHTERLILKRVSRECDVMMRLTDDRFGRETIVWTTGLLDRLPTEFGHAYLGCSRDDDGWAILMRDLDGYFLPAEPAGVAGERNLRIVDALAALHAAFWDEAEAARSIEGFCSPWHFFHLPSLAAAEEEAVSGMPLIGRIIDGWEAARLIVDHAVVDAGIALANDPTALCDALARYPQTLLHGDVRAPNLAVEPHGTAAITAIDWAYAGFGSPLQDVVWYLGRSPVHRTDSNEMTLAAYQSSLTRRLGSRFNTDWWEPMLTLGYVAGFVRCACFNAWHAAHSPDAGVRARERQELLWWAGKATSGLAIL